MNGARVVVGWRRRQEEATEWAAAEAVALCGRSCRGCKKRCASRPGFDAEASRLAKRDYKTKWAREHPKTGQRWRQANRDRDNANARAYYQAHLDAKRAYGRAHQQRRRDAMRAELSV